MVSEEIVMGVEMLLLFWRFLTLGTVYLYVYDRLHHALFFLAESTRLDVSHVRCVVIREHRDQNVFVLAITRVVPSDFVSHVKTLGVSWRCD